MALLSDLVRTLALAEGLEEVSVGIYARHAREAGYITQAGRGRGAARMTWRDAANLIIAVNGCALAKDVAQGVRRLRELTSESALSSRTKPDLLRGMFAREMHFGEAMEILLEACSPNPEGNIELDEAMRAAVIAWHKALTRNSQGVENVMARLMSVPLRLEIIFKRPHSEAEISILSKDVLLRSIPHRDGWQIIASTMFRVFDVDEIRTDHGDRRDTVTITDKTIRDIAMTMRNL